MHAGEDQLDLTRGAPSIHSAPANSGSSGTVFQLEREELERVINHPEVKRSPSLVRFLTFICSKYFAGESQDIREQTIAVEALGRKASTFDSHVDPIVRVTARALRKKLNEVYRSEGQAHPLRIVLPVGHYVPEFIPAGQVSGLEQTTNGDDGSETLEETAPQPETFAARALKVLSGHPLLRYCAILLGAAALFGGGYFAGRMGNRSEVPATRTLQWGAPIWDDEFESAAKAAPDTGKWSFGLGNNSALLNPNVGEYCPPGSSSTKGCDARRPNVFLDGNGHLILRARKNPDGSWTSGRITTQATKSFQYGRIEARLKMPVGTGLWPTFWMLGASAETLGWPASGSVDIAENVALLPHSNGLGPRMIRTTLHGPRYFGANGLWHDFKLPNGARVDDGSFHTYGIIWSPGMIQFYVDDPANIYFVQDSSSLPEGGEWVFDHPFFLILNLGVGGDWPGYPDATTPNPSDLVVDYVRVYRIPTVPAPSIAWTPIRVKAGASAASIVSLHARSYTGRVLLSCSTQPATATCSLATRIANFSDTLSQENTLTISTDTFTEKGRLLAAPGEYKVTITATTISGDRSQIVKPFTVSSGN